MSAREDEDMQDRGEQEPIDDLLVEDLLALDRELLLRAANQQIARGMYARIARAHAERRPVTAARWRWGLAVAAAACLALPAVWFAMPAKHVKEAKDVNPGNPPGHETISLAPVPGRVDVQPTVTIRPGKKLARSAPRAYSVMAREIAPRQATFPLNVAPTEQEVLLMQLASHQPKELLAVAKAIAEMKDRDDRERHDFDQWVQKGETQ
jgi:hypothetical protein